MIELSEKHHLESIIALSMATKGNLDKNLTEQESEKNLLQNIVEISINKKSNDLSFDFLITGSGLMITTSGFILTTYHCIQDVEDDWKRINKEDPLTQENQNLRLSNTKNRYYVMDKNGNKYPLDISFLRTNPDRDIALIKAVTNKKPEPIKFKIMDDPLQVNEGIKLFGIVKNNSYNQYGKVKLTDHNIQIPFPESEEVQIDIYDTFLTNAQGVQGFSGGVFINLQGKFAGLALYMQHPSDEDVGEIGGAKINYISQLVENSAYELGKKILME